MQQIYVGGVANSHANTHFPVTDEGKRVNFKQNISGLLMKYADMDYAPEFSIGVGYEEKRLKDKREKEKEEKEQAKAESPFFVDEGIQAKYKNVYPQAIASLHRKVGEMQLQGTNVQQTEGLHDALDKTQWLMKACLSNFKGTGIPSDVAHYMADLGKVQSLLMQSLAGVTARETQEAGSKAI